jgi:hypothetical protein
MARPAPTPADRRNASGREAAPATITGMAHNEPQMLPLVSECSLDPEAIRVQRKRYAALGRDLVDFERQRGRLTATFAPTVDGDLVRETIEVERECCPFFALVYDPAESRLSITVDDPAQEPALDALRYSLTEGA